MNDHNTKVAWNKSKLIGQRRPLRIEQVWAIRVRLEINENIRDLALFNMAIDSMLRGCELVRLLVRDICHDEGIQSRAQIIQKKYR